MYSKNERVRFLIKELKKSQEAFGNGIHRSRSEIANIVYDKVVVKDDVVKAICDVYNVNRIWLETGSGEPFQEMSRAEKLAEVFGGILAGHKSEKNAFIEAVAQLPEELFPVFVQAWIEAAEQMKKSLEE